MDGLGSPSYRPRTDLEVRRTGHGRTRKSVVLAMDGLGSPSYCPWTDSEVRRTVHGRTWKSVVLALHNNDFTKATSPSRFGLGLVVFILPLA
jgi:hypothetical protein